MWKTDGDIWAFECSDRRHDEGFGLPVPMGMNNVTVRYSDVWLKRPVHFRETRETIA
jgi:hypothetical protein